MKKAVLEIKTVPVQLTPENWEFIVKWCARRSRELGRLVTLDEGINEAMRLYGASRTVDAGSEMPQ